MKKRIFALVLALVLCLSVLPLGAMAEDKPVYRIVNVGDSTGIGIGLNDCGIHQQEDVWSCLTQWSGTKNKGYFDYMSPRSSYALLAQYVREELSDYTVESVNLGRTGIRASEFRELINRDYEGDVYAQEVADTVRTDLPRAFDLGAFGTDVDGYYVDQISRADLINVDASLNSFTWYLVDRLSASDDDPRFQESVLDLLAIGTPQMKTQLNCLEQTLKSTVGALLPKNIATHLIDTVLYCTMDMFVNFDGLIRDIRAINPKATILCGGLYNPFRGMKAEVGGVVIDISSLTDAAIGIADAYLSTFCPSRDEYVFYDVPNGAQTIREYMQQYASVGDVPLETLHCVIDDLYCGMHHERIRSVAAAEGVDISGYGEMIWPWDVLEAYTAVRGEPASATDAQRLIVREFSKYLELLLKGLQSATIDIELLTSGLLNGDHHQTVMEWVDIPFEELSGAQKSLCFIAASEARAGASVHFSENGCREKFEAEKAALKGRLPAPPVTRYVNEITDGLLKTVVKSIQLTVKNTGKILGTLGKLLKR